jgi:hypothetical protein
MNEREMFITHQQSKFLQARTRLSSEPNYSQEDPTEKPTYFQDQDIVKTCVPTDSTLWNKINPSAL